MKPETIYDWQNIEILITGGAGSLGKTLTKLLLKKYKPKGIRIFSRDEYKHQVMKQELLNEGYTGNVAYLIGDVREKRRLSLAFSGVDIVINAAAMKQVGACEDNPIEAAKTNIYSVENIVEAAIESKVSEVLHISTDKAVYPINLYGMTKGAAEKIFIHSNVYSPHGTKFSCCRYGNVLGSRGSIIPVIKERIKNKLPIKITDLEMTRFWISLPRVAQFIMDRIMDMRGAEIFVPKMPSTRLVDMLAFIMPEKGYPIENMGIRPGEKIHETLITHEESKNTSSFADYFTIKQQKENMNFQNAWSYDSQNNPYRMNKKEFKIMMEERI